MAALAVRPRLWPTAVRQLRLMAPRRWWASPPYLPRPDPDYLHFRLRSMYGDAATGHEPEVPPRDLVAYLEWCRSWRVSSRL